MRMEDNKDSSPANYNEQVCKKNAKRREEIKIRLDMLHEILDSTSYQ
ncbi:25965_t:CDS:1, partial [Dentiscutata erythropus]